MGISEPMDMRMLSELQNYLGAVNSMSTGEVVLSRNLIDTLYNPWLREHENEIDKRKLPIEIQGFYSRLATYVIKFSIIYEAMLSGTNHITTDSMCYAIRVVEFLKKHLVNLLEEEMVVGRDANDLKKIKDIVKREPGISKKQILQKTHLLARRADDLLVTLLESGELECQKIPTKTKPKEVYYIGANKGA
jgi:hypothetical protein